VAFDAAVGCVLAGSHNCPATYRRSSSAAAERWFGFDSMTAVYGYLGGLCCVMVFWRASDWRVVALTLGDTGPAQDACNGWCGPAGVQQIKTCGVARLSRPGHVVL
jgi:hypothetical protein